MALELLIIAALVGRIASRGGRLVVWDLLPLAVKGGLS
jgi:hypothetical protein